ncbi:uncharacterized protein [Populus alba]|uniref:uncharacterized protein n=1 Tax=Populus alba TaxID=43335 RepID=UPI00158E44D2|nr:uncharacterized protein LOC118063028 [Populus alba]
MDRIRKYEDLNKKYMDLESKKGGFEDVKAELAVKKNEIKVMRIKLDKEREKSKLRNIGPPPRIHNTRQRARMENEGRSQPESQYQRELEGVRNDVAHLTSMLEQLLRARDGEGTSTQPNEAPAAAQIPVAPINIGANTPTKQSPARPIQIPITMDLTNEDPYDFKFSNHEGDDKWTALEERLRAIEGNDLFDPIRAAEVCLVPNIVIPKKFRVPEFVKYTGIECPKTHLRSYYNKMAEVIHDEKMLIYFFQDSLTGSALSWYMRLDNIRIRKWTDLADAFLKQYKFNLEIAPDRTSLISMEKGTQESVRAYAQRWRDQAINVQPPLIETKMVTLFANTFRAPYYEHLMGSSAQHFYDVVRIAERIEQGIRSGRIAEPLEKRGFIGRKKEIEVNNLERRSKNYQIPTPRVTSINFSKPPTPNQPNPVKFPANNHHNYQRKDKQLSEEQLPPLPITLKELYAKLLSIGQIAPLPIPPMQPPFPAWYNPEVTCEYHAGHAGHSIEACFAFKRKVLQLIKVGWVTFEDSPNQNSNPLPKNVDGRGGVNTMEIGSKKRVLKATMAKLYLMLVQSGHLEETTEYCTGESNFCPLHKKEGHHIDECMEFHQKVARMLTLGELRIENISDNEEVEMIEKCRIQLIANGRSKLVLTRPSYASKVDYGAMPGDYGYTSNIEAPLPLFQTEISGLTRSDRCFTPEELERQRKTKARRCWTSIKSLSSEPHRNALQKVLNEAYVPQDIEQKTMEHLVGRIHAANYLYFTEDELNAEGTGHNKPLYVTVRCKDCLVGKIPHICNPSVITARAYDGSSRPVVGSIEVELVVGPQVFLVTLQVMDIHPSYSMLLGRPWIHSAGAVTSSLHQCLKYIANGVLVTVKAEETISICEKCDICHTTCHNLSMICNRGNEESAISAGVYVLSGSLTAKCYVVKRSAAAVIILSDKEAVSWFQLKLQFGCLPPITRLSMKLAFLVWKAALEMNIKKIDVYGERPQALQLHFANVQDHPKYTGNNQEKRKPLQVPLTKPNIPVSA